MYLKMVIYADGLAICFGVVQSRAYDASQRHFEVVILSALV